MGEIYDKMQENGYIERVFFGGYPKTKNEFLAFMKDSFNTVFIAREKDLLILIAWVNGINGKRGTIHFCSFPNIFARKKTRAFRKILKMVFNFLSVLIAQVPESYEEARKGCKLMGFKDLGVIPHFSYFLKENKTIGNNILYITKDLLEAQNG